MSNLHFPLAFICEKMYYIDIEIVKFRTLDNKAYFEWTNAFI